MSGATRWTHEVLCVAVKMRREGASWKAVAAKLDGNIQSIIAAIETYGGVECFDTEPEPVPQPKARLCLCGCGRKFTSMHIGDRIRPECRETWSERT